MKCSLAMAGDDIVPDVDRASVKVEHSAAASTAMKRCAGTCLANDNCHLPHIIIGTGTVSPGD
jgi:hypothetical protein